MATFILSGQRTMLAAICFVVVSGLLQNGVGCASAADDLPGLMADRTAIERVYYTHRLGEKPRFEETLPPQVVEKLVRLDLRKEAILRQVYGFEITPEMIAEEAARIERTSRAPEVLAELHRALAEDKERFARTVIRPILVERELRGRFENDDRLHTQQRQAAEKIRSELLQAQKQGEAGTNLAAKLKLSAVGAVNEVAWLLAARPHATVIPPNGPLSPPKAITATSGLYSVSATAQAAQPVASPEKNAAEEAVYFEDLSPELQPILRARLKQPGDISAVIETPVNFLLFVATGKTPAKLSAVSLTIPKRGYEQWLAEQGMVTATK